MGNVFNVIEKMVKKEAPRKASKKKSVKKKVVKKKAVKRKPVKKKIKKKIVKKKKMVRKKSHVKKKVVKRKSVRKKVGKKLVKKKAAKRKKPVRKKIVKKNPGKSSSVSRRDFETFQVGVERLTELRKELNSLDTRGFNREEQEIKSKLKNVSEIPDIERKLKVLKLKINKKYRPKRRAQSKSGVTEDIRDIKEKMGELSKKVKSSETRRSIDPGVDVLVDSNFSEFLNETKSALSERIDNKEKELDNVLKEDLHKRELAFKERRLSIIRNFNKKKEELEAEFEKKYESKVKSSLSKEISEKLNKAVQKKFDSYKNKLRRQYLNEMKRHAQQELERQRRAMELRLREEVDKEKSKLQREKKDFVLQKEEVRRRIKKNLTDEFHGKLEREVAMKRRQVKSQLKGEFELKLKKHIQDHEEDLRRKKLDLEIDMQKRMKQVLTP